MSLQNNMGFYSCEPMTCNSEMTTGRQLFAYEACDNCNIFTWPSSSTRTSEFYETISESSCDSDSFRHSDCSDVNEMLDNETVDSEKLDIFVNFISRSSVPAADGNKKTLTIIADEDIEAVLSTNCWQLAELQHTVPPSSSSSTDVPSPSDIYDTSSNYGNNNSSPYAGIQPSDSGGHFTYYFSSEGSTFATSVEHEINLYSPNSVNADVINWRSDSIATLTTSLTSPDNGDSNTFQVLADDNYKLLPEANLMLGLCDQWQPLSTCDAAADDDKEIRISCEVSNAEPNENKQSTTSSTTSVRNRKKLPGVIQFLYDSLQSNQSYVTWVDEKRGRFKVNDSKAIARAWAGRKEGKPRDNHKTPSVENFSRAIRYYKEVIKPEAKQKKSVLLRVTGKRMELEFNDEFFSIVNLH